MSYMESSIPRLEWPARQKLHLHVHVGQPIFYFSCMGGADGSPSQERESSPQD